MYNILFYEDEQGYRPVEDFIDQLDAAAHICELRPGDNRILFFGWNGNQFVLLHHFAKTTQKTPPKEIAIAERRMDNWLTRKR